MRYPIDVLFLDQGRVLGAVKRLVPNRISPIYLRAESVLELPAGTIEETHTEPGDYVEMEGVEEEPD